MYYPIFRGKQYEFLTLNDTRLKLKDSRKIIPVIEPVKSAERSLNGMYRCFDILKDESLEAIFIVNPRCKKGDFTNKLELLNPVIKKLKDNYPNISFGYWIGDKTNDLDLEVFLNSIKSKFYLFHYSEYPNLNNILPMLSQNSFKGHFLDVDVLSDGYISSINFLKICLRDNFISLNSNEDYRLDNDHQFTNNYLSFRDDNYIGFSDYLMIGSQYFDDNGTPTTVTIHITYETDDKSSIRVRHLLSNHYKVNQDRGKMIRQALIELKDFLIEKNEILDYSSACNELMSILENEDKNTNLATLKKLAMKHHLELIIEILREDPISNFNEAS